MEYIVSFVLSVMASVVGNCISKWFSYGTDISPTSSPKKNPEVAPSGFFVCVSSRKHKVSFVILSLYTAKSVLSRLFWIRLFNVRSADKIICACAEYIRNAAQYLNGDTADAVFIA